MICLNYITTWHPILLTVGILLLILAGLALFLTFRKGNAELFFVFLFLGILGFGLTSVGIDYGIQIDTYKENPAAAYCEDNGMKFKES